MILSSYSYFWNEKKPNSEVSISNLFIIFLDCEWWFQHKFNIESACSLTDVIYPNIFVTSLTTSSSSTSWTLQATNTPTTGPTATYVASYLSNSSISYSNYYKTDAYLTTMAVTTFYFAELEERNITLDVMCSAYGYDSITYTITGSLGAGGSAAIDPTTGDLDIVAPQLGNPWTPETYDLQIYSESDSILFTQLVTITIVVEGYWPISGCASIDTTNLDNWNKWESGYYLSPDHSECTLIGNLDTISTVTTSFTTVTAILAAACMSFGGMPGQTMWMVINQYQLYLLIPLMRVYVPGDIMYYLLGQSFAIFNFKFLHFDSSALYKSINKLLDFQQSELGLSTIEINSGSSVVNLLSTIFIVIIGLLCQIFWGLILKLLKKWKPKSSLIDKLDKKYESFFKYPFYVVYFIETFMVASISFTSEIYRFDKSHLVSLLLTFSMWCASIALVVFLIVRYQKDSTNEQSKFKVLYEDLKESKRARVYWFVFLGHRFLLAVILNCGYILEVRPQLWLFVFVHILGLGYSAIVRPFNKWYNNWIEVQNYAVYLVLIVHNTSLIHKSDWKGVHSKIIVNVLMINGLVTCGIILTVWSVTTISGFLSYFKSKSAKVIPSEENSIQSKTIKSQYISNATEHTSIVLQNESSMVKMNDFRVKRY